MVLSAALFDKPPFLKCIYHGVVLDKKGQKLSKRYNNFANPKDVLEIYGAEALRFMMLSSSVVSRGDLLLNKDAKNIKDYLRVNIKSIWQSYYFFCLYANADQISAKLNYEYKNVFDRYIIAELTHYIKVISIAVLIFV